VNASPSNATFQRQPYVRKETFLARYPRKLKLGVTGIVVAVLFAAAYFPAGEIPSEAELRDFATSALHKIPEIEGAGSVSHTEAAPQPVSTTPGVPVPAFNEIDDRSVRMVHAPVHGLTEDTADGALPRVSDDGRKPWQVYARPFNMNDKRPRVAVVMVDLGLSRVATDAALRRLPAAVTLAFDVQSPVTSSWLGRARQDGHETLLSLPSEPFDFPRSDPGPNALLTNLPGSDIVQRINWALKQGSGYVGVTTLSGSRFTTDPSKVSLLLDVLKRRGLMVFDARVAPHSVLRDMAKQSQIPVAISSIHIDKEPSPAAIDASLRQLEQAAQLNGRAVGVASPLPVTLDHLETWAKQLAGRGVVLAPVSAVVE